MKYLLTLFFISLVSIGKGQSMIKNAHVSFRNDGTCLYDSMGRLIRVESGKCSLLEMVYDKGKWVPYSKCSYCKSKHIKEQTKIDTTTPPHGGMAYPDPMQPLPKKDTISASFHDIVFLMQQNMELSQRIDRLEERIDSLERRPVIYIDNLQKELWVKCPDGSCDIFIRKL